MTTNQKALTVAPVKQEEYTTIDTIKCHSCGDNVEILQDENHHEYVPFGKCKKCRVLHIITKSKEIITIGVIA